MRKIVLKQSDKDYLEKCASEHKFAYGVIIGQRTEDEKFVVIHLARNGEEDVEISESSETEIMDGVIQCVTNIDTQTVANQYINASKMIPGSFTILGIFITSESNKIFEENTFKCAQTLLCAIIRLISHNGNLFGFCGYDSVEILLLLNSALSKTTMCMAYLNTMNGGTFYPVECCLNEIPYTWLVFESNYELDDIFPIIDAAEKINIENQFRLALASVKTNLTTSEIFIQNESVDESLWLETYIKEKYGKLDNIQEHFKTSILFPVIKMSKDNRIEVKEFKGTIRFSGVISSRIWCHTKNTIKEIKTFIRTDILRSLNARIQMYCDGLTLPNAGLDGIVINEPPRRVYFNLPFQGIQFSEYIFRGETPMVAVAQAKQVLDLYINSESIYADVEELPEDDVLQSSQTENRSLKLNNSTSHREISQIMYMLGIAIALLVLIISIFLNFFML